MVQRLNRLKFTAIWKQRVADGLCFKEEKMVALISTECG